MPHPQHADWAGFLGWLQERRSRRDITDRTASDYRHGAQQFLLWAEGKDASPTQAATLARYAEELQKRGNAGITIRSKFTAIKAWFEYLADAYPNQADALPDPNRTRKPRVGPSHVPTPTDAQTQAMFKGLASWPSATPAQRFARDRMEAALSILCYCALRRSELLALDVSDVKPLPGGRYALQVRVGKGLQSRAVPLVGQAQDVLLKWLRTREAWASGRTVITPALLPYNADKRWGTVGLTLAWRQMLKSAGLEDSGLFPRGCRRYCASRASEKRITNAQLILGHSSPATTYRYLHSSEDDVWAAAEDVARHIEAAPQQKDNTEPASPAPARNRAPAARGVHSGRRQSGRSTRRIRPPAPPAGGERNGRKR